jgi:hypothetical protein
VHRSVLCEQAQIIDLPRILFSCQQVQLVTPAQYMLTAFPFEAIKNAPIHVICQNLASMTHLRRIRSEWVLLQYGFATPRVL